jgi:hypothetical protein
MIYMMQLGFEVGEVVKLTQTSTDYLHESDLRRVLDRGKAQSAADIR